MHKEERMFRLNILLVFQYMLESHLKIGNTFDSSADTDHLNKQEMLDRKINTIIILADFYTSIVLSS